MKHFHRNRKAVLHRRAIKMKTPRRVPFGFPEKDKIFNNLRFNAAMNLTHNHWKRRRAHTVNPFGFRSWRKKKRLNWRWRRSSMRLTIIISDDKQRNRRNQINEKSHFEKQPTPTTTPSKTTTEKQDEFWISIFSPSCEEQLRTLETEKLL